MKKTGAFPVPVNKTLPLYRPAEVSTAPEPDRQVPGIREGKWPLFNDQVKGIMIDGGTKRNDSYMYVESVLNQDT